MSTKSSAQRDGARHAHAPHQLEGLGQGTREQSLVSDAYATASQTCDETAPFASLKGHWNGTLG
jgi:hypothetical protein